MIKNLIKYFRCKKEHSLFTGRLIDYADLYFNQHITFYPSLLPEPGWDGLLVLTPHADDETLGCGGLLLKAVQKNKRIKVILYSDNSESINGQDKNDIIDARSSEFKKAMKTLGIQDYVELKTAPKDFINSQSLITATLEIVSGFSPSVILLPSFIDNHEEHKTLNKILLNALLKYNIETEIMMFEVWTAFTPNTILDISDIINKKIETISCYKSQLKNINYIDSITGLNRYRSITNLQGNGYAEGFVRLSRNRYIQLAKKYV
jgi:N-acetylglucosamine malate deacetylase 1